MKKNLIISLLLSVLFVTITNCLSRDTKQIVKTIEKPKFKEITLSCVDSIILPIVENVKHWKYSNNRLYACAPVSHNNFLQVYSYPDFSLLYQYGSKGQGPGEFISVNWGKTYVEDEFILYDIMKRQMHVFIFGETEQTKVNSFNLYDGDGFVGFSKPFTMINKINDTVFLMKVNLRDQIALETADLKNHKVLHSSPGSFIYTKPGHVGYYEYEVEYRNNTVVCAFHRINRIEISTIDKDYNINKKIIIGEDKVDTDQSFNTTYYTDLKCEGNHIYAAFQNDNNTAIEVYDLKGNAVHKLLLDRDIGIFFVSPDSKFIYGYYQTMESDIILKYRI
jgi:hypothetical protein